jgi:hypothetical protein
MVSELVKEPGLATAKLSVETISSMGRLFEIYAFAPALRARWANKDGSLRERTMIATVALIFLIH